MRDAKVDDKNDRVLGQLLAFAVLLATVWIVIVCSLNGSGGAIAYYAVATFAVIYPLHFIVSGIAIWRRVKRKASVRLTTLVCLVPWVTFPVPFLLNSLNREGPLFDSPQKITTAVLVLTGLPIVLAILQPRRMAQLLPAFLLRSFVLNLLVLMATLGLYLLPIGFLAFGWAAMDQQPTSTNEEGYLLAYGAIALVVYVVASALPAALVLAYSGLSFFQDQFTDHRRLRVAQLIASLPLVLMAILVAVWQPLRG